jgi:hypothetical protein
VAAVSADDLTAYITALTGYSPPAGDTVLIGYIEQSVEQNILNDTAQDAIPDGLVWYLKQRVAGEYITARKAAILGDDNLQIVKSIAEGAVTVKLGGTSAEERLDALSAELTKGHDTRCYRKLRW